MGVGVGGGVQVSLAAAVVERDAVRTRVVTAAGDALEAAGAGRLHAEGAESGQGQDLLTRVWNPDPAEASYM